MPRPYRHAAYLLLWCLLCLPAVAAVGMNYLYLRNTGEFLPLEDIVHRQQADGRFCIYGTALHKDVLAHKLLSYRARQPDVVALGSSIVLQMRERFFRIPFYNFGGVMGSVHDGRLAADLFLQAHMPKIVLLNVDFWWFPQSYVPYERPRAELDTARFTLDKVLQPFFWIFRGKLSLREYAGTAFGLSDPAAPCTIGVQAREKLRGDGPDGSYYYTSQITGADLDDASPKFANALRDIDRGDNHHSFSTDVNHRSVGQFIDLIRTLQSKGITVVTYFPPLAPLVNEHLRAHPKVDAYIPTLLRALDQAGIAYFNFLDPRSVDADDCEYVEGHHPGDVASARILRTIYERTNNPVVRSAIAIDVVEATIRENAGRAMQRDPRITEKPEVDFLHLGCKGKVQLQNR